MSSEKLSWALKQPIKPASKKLVLIALGDSCPTNGVAYPSTETIVHLTSLDRKTVVKCLDALQLDGLISDTGQRVGTTKQIKVFRLNDRAEVKNGTLSEKAPETGMLLDIKAPVFPEKAPVFSMEGSQKRDTKGSQKRDTERKEELEGELKEEGKPVLPQKFLTSRMTGKWGIWKEARKGRRKPKDWELLFKEQMEWLSQYDEPTAMEILSYSLRNGYQGLFPPKDHGQNRRRSEASTAEYVDVRSL